uniref:Uncharacterized protein n=1 Tax=Strigamia maritima TaxID=126957 RepID=T1J776_STRMM
ESKSGYTFGPIIESKHSILQDRNYCHIPLVSSRKSESQSDFVMTRFKNPHLCSVSLLKFYLNYTKLLRRGNERLFLVASRPHNAVTATSVARWIKDVLASAEVNTPDPLGRQPHLSLLKKELV